MNPVYPHRGSGERGVASVEAVVFLPFMLLLFFGVTFVHQRYDATQRAWVSARSCAWAYSQQGCTGPMPAACGAQTVTADLPQNADLNEAIPPDPEHGDDDVLTPKANTLLGEPRSTLFGEYATVTGSVKFTPPRMFGGERTVSAPYHLACNLEPKTLGDLVGDLFGMLTFE